jgi:hypothetical protein
MKKVYCTIIVIFLMISGMEAQNQYYGVWTQNPEITENWGVDDVGRHMYIWDGTLAEAGIEPAVSYGDPLAFAGQNPEWWGFGLWDDNGTDISDFANGHLVYYIASDYQGNVEIIISDNTAAENEIKWILTTSDFERNGEWHQISLPISEAVAAGVDLSSMGHVFAAAGGGQPSLIAFDDIHYVTEAQSTAINNSQKDISFSFSPNPVNEILNVISERAVEQISIVNMSGKKVYEKQNLSANSKLAINVSAWAKGLYFIIATDSAGNSNTRKIIVR